MALPVVLGLPWLVGIIVTAFTSLVAWFAQFITKRLAIVAAAVAFLAGLTSALFLAIEALLGGLALTMPAQIIQGAAFVMPSNISECLTIYLSANLLRYVYDWQCKFVQLKLF